MKTQHSIEKEKSSGSPKAGRSAPPEDTLKDSSKPTAVTARSQTQNSAFRGYLPANKKPLFVRVLNNEHVLTNDVKTPHSPLNIVNPSIIPHSVHGGKCRKACLRTQTSFIRSTSISRSGQKPHVPKKLIDGSLSYNAFYQTQNYHIVN
jgi:hypothetical protein